MSTAVIWSKSKADVWRTLGRIPWHVITMQGAANWWIHCYDSRATCHIAGCSHLAKSMSWSCHIAECNNFIRHIKNRFTPYFISMVCNAVWALTSGGFRIVSDTLVINAFIHFLLYYYTFSYFDFELSWMICNIYFGSQINYYLVTSFITIVQQLYKYWT